MKERNKLNNIIHHLKRSRGRKKVKGVKCALGIHSLIADISLVGAW